MQPSKMFKHNLLKKKKTIKLSNRRSRNKLMNFENEILYVFHYFKIALFQFVPRLKKNFFLVKGIRYPSVKIRFASQFQRSF